MHFVQAEGRGPAPFPLLLAHGWPDGFNRVAKLIPLLADRGAPPDDLSASEARCIASAKRFRAGGRRLHVYQDTKPWTPAAALNDSPAGLLAWTVEKFQAWSDCGADPRNSYTPDELITNAMLYWVTQTIGTSFLPYRDSTDPGLVQYAVDGVKGLLGSNRTPAGFALFPQDIASPPREWAERFFDVHHWTEMPAGGHFAAMEQPERLAADIQAFFRPLRGAVFGHGAPAGPNN